LSESPRSTLLLCACAPPPAPHPCPTRRSSDLLVVQGHGFVKVADNEKKFRFIKWLGQESVFAESVKLSGACRKLCVARHTNAQGDRKSTRLNSSHVKISYAVFCLKKKK